MEKMTTTVNVDIYDTIDTIQGGITGTYKWLREMGLSPEDCKLAITQATTNAMVTEYCNEIIERNRGKSNADNESTN
jgi:hypothetical protein